MSLVLFLALSACRSGDKETLDTAALVVDEDGDGFNAGEDCDDSDAAIHPGATEICDGVDNDCNAQIDEGVLSTFYVDSDGDGFGGGMTVEACEQPANGAQNDLDCDDTDSTIHPDAPERCDGVDQDCDGEIDEEVTSTWYADSDGDLHGDPDAPLEDCDPPEGYSAVADDCDDSASSVHPGATEVCNDVDDNCDGSVDEGLDQVWYADSDGDLYGDASVSLTDCAQPSGYVSNDQDCDDSSSLSNPGSAEVCDELDNNCDGSVDEGVEDTFYADTDGDGYGDSASTTSACSAPSGYADNARDCDDSDASLNPDTVWYLDYDSDGYGTGSFTSKSCTQPSGYVSDSTDCDDAEAATYPGADETCDDADNDCDSSVDESPIDGDTFYADTDGDGYGDPDSSIVACEEGSGYVSDNSDCEDGDATAYPGTPTAETPGDGVDQNCDGNDGCDDLDCDALPDMVLADYRTSSSYNTNVYLYYNDGGGYSDADRDTLSYGYGIYDVDVADLDGDGYQDVLGTSYYDGNYATNSVIWWGSSSGYSDSDVSTLPTQGARRAVIEDLDLDGYLDVAFANYYDGSSYSIDSYVYWGSASGFSSSNRTDLETLGAIRLEAEDLDADGYPDLIFCNHRSSSTDFTVNSYVYWGSASGYSTSSRNSLPTNGCRGLETGDYDGDGSIDIAFGAYRRTSSDYSTDSYVYYQTTSGYYSTGSREAFSTRGIISVSDGDFDGDGTTDLAFSGYYNGSWSSNTYQYVFMNSSAGFGSADTLGGRGQWGTVVSDVDGDGYDDLLSARYRSGSTDFTVNSYLWWGSSTGLSDSSREDIPTSGAAYGTIGDIDADGYPEIIFGNYRDNSGVGENSYVYFGSTTYSWSSSARDTLSTKGTWAAPVLVGDASW